jgi:anti-anti-sigma factor
MLPADLGALVLDVSELKFCDSRGLAQMIALRNAAMERGATFHLTGVSGQVARALAHTGLDRVLNLR